MKNKQNIFQIIISETSRAFGDFLNEMGNLVEDKQGRKYQRTKTEKLLDDFDQGKITPFELTSGITKHQFLE